MGAEYLAATKDYTADRHSGEFISQEMKSIMHGFGGPQRFCAIVTDNARNMKSARDIICNEYPHILNLRCM